jgi:hypothetical protein
MRPIHVDPARPVISIPSYNGARNTPNLVPLLACLLAAAPSPSSPSAAALPPAIAPTPAMQAALAEFAIKLNASAALQAPQALQAAALRKSSGTPAAAPASPGSGPERRCDQGS